MPKRNSDASERVAIVAALGLLEAGDPDEAVEVLLGALEDGPEPPRCPVCGRPAWPGDYARHVRSVHRAAEEEVDRAA